MNTETQKAKPRKSRSKILWEISLLVLAVFIIAVTIIALVYNNSTAKLVEKSKKDLIKTQAKTLSAGFDSLIDIISEMILGKFGSQETLGNYIDSIKNKKPLPVTVEANTTMRSIAEKGIVADGYLTVVMPDFPPVFEEPIVIVTSEDKLLFKEVPGQVFSIVESGDGYGIIEGGLPEWGLEGEQLVVFREVDTPYAGGMTVYAIGIRPIQEDVERIYESYDDEKSRINLLIGIVTVLSVVFLFLITFFVLRYLISSRITKPMDELSATAEKVMEGDLDVEVPVKKGEEFENLKRAFNEMLKSLRSLFSRATGE